MAAKFLLLTLAFLPLPLWAEVEWSSSYDSMRHAHWDQASGSYQLAKKWEDLSDKDKKRVREAKERYDKLPNKRKTKLREKWENMPPEEKKKYRLDKKYR